MSLQVGLNGHQDQGKVAADEIANGIVHQGSTDPLNELAGATTAAPLVEPATAA
jgi:hypothetical protein